MRVTRITVDARQMDGVPCIRGRRILVADGMTEPEILSRCPDLERDDLAGALDRAARGLDHGIGVTLTAPEGFWRAYGRSLEDRKTCRDFRQFLCADPTSRKFAPILRGSSGLDAELPHC